MNKHEALKQFLMGAEPSIPWCTDHQPLLSPQLFTEKGRRLNRFCVGSDPEFAIERADDPGSRYEAAAIGLHVGVAAGADQNERLIELRPYPSVSVVEHVAGMLTALRWLYRTNQYAQINWWRAGAFFAGDGMGGHVHFGRKRPTRKEEVEALDGLAMVMRVTGLFPEKEWKQRTAGDRYHNAPYGQYGDFRVQAHGYEYRTLPSWLQSPKIAFTAVCASKLAVLDPEITTAWTKHKVNPEKARTLLRGLAKLYKGRDDDAYILYHLLTVQGDGFFAINHQADFRCCWGIPTERANTTHFAADAATILPGSIKPTEREINQVRDHLLMDIPITYERLPKTFKGEIPERYVWVPSVVRPQRRAGFGDFIHNMVYSKEMPIEIGFGAHNEFHVSGIFVERWTAAERALLKEFYPTVQFLARGDYGERLTVPRDYCKTGPISGLRAIVFNSGLFPLWTVDSVKPESYLNWVKNHSKVRNQQVQWRNL